MQSVLLNRLELKTFGSLKTNKFLESAKCVCSAFHLQILLSHFLQSKVSKILV